MPSNIIDAGSGTCELMMSVLIAGLPPGPSGGIASEKPKNSNGVLAGSPSAASNSGPLVSTPVAEMSPRLAIEESKVSIEPVRNVMGSTQLPAASSVPSESPGMQPARLMKLPAPVLEVEIAEQMAAGRNR